MPGKKFWGPGEIRFVTGLAMCFCYAQQATKSVPGVRTLVRHASKLSRKMEGSALIVCTNLPILRVFSLSILELNLHKCGLVFSRHG